MLTLFLTFLMSIASAKDQTSNGSVVGRPAVTIDCANVFIDEEAMRAEHIALLQEGCLEAGRIEIAGRTADGERFATELDALGRYHLATTVPVGGSSYADGHKIATGEAALYASAFASPRTGFGVNGVVIGQSFAQFGGLDALDRVGISGGGLPPRSTTSTTTTRTTTVPARSDAEIMAEDAARRQADADTAKAAADALKPPAGQ